MPDYRYAANDPRHHGRADNAGFSIVIALAGVIALGLMAAAITHDESAERISKAAIAGHMVTAASTTPN